MTSSEGSQCSLCEKIGFKPFTRNNVFYYYVPLTSMISYAGLAVNVMNPPLAARLIPKRDVTNILLSCTIFGTSLYIYSRPHLEAITTTPGKRAAYSVLGSLLFGMGSVLVWALIRSGLPNKNALTTTLGIATGVAIVKLSKDYFDDCDKQAAVKK